MLSAELATENGRIVAEYEDFRVHEMVMSKEKLQWLWTEMQKYRTLFSDLTRGDLDNFAGLVLSNDSIWFEVYAHDVLVGIIYFTEMHLVIDCETHLIFFDRKPKEKTELCKQVARWMFDNFPINRITATIPKIYWATIALAKAIGFQVEGRKRQSQLMGNRWVDEVILGLLRSEV